MSDSGAGLEANAAEAERCFFPPEVIFCFLSFLFLWGMNRFGLIPGFSVAESRSDGSQSHEFSFWQRPGVFLSSFKSDGISKQRKNAHQNSRRINMTQGVFPPLGGVICFWFTPT